jgi:Ni,Fe-hydrogenase III large subunit
LIGPNQVSDEIVREKTRKTRYLTNTRTTQALNKRESVANMHERVTGLRQTSSLYCIGVDKT